MSVLLLGLFGGTLMLVTYLILWTDVLLYWSDPIISHHRYRHYLLKKKQVTEEKISLQETETEKKKKIGQKKKKQENKKENEGAETEQKTNTDNTKSNNGKFLVVGVGFSGLAACAALKRHDIEFDAVERNLEIGGNWFNGVYETVHIISSKRTTEYKDWPMPDHYPDFPSAKQMIRYLNDYCDFFELRDHVSFGTEVTSLVKCASSGDDGAGNGDGCDDCDGGWKVVMKDLATGKERTAVYRGVIIANGHHWDRRMPQYTGQELFTGEMIHSKDYKKPEQLKGKRVLIIGGGNSACDIAVESARFATEAHISLRRGYWFIPRSIFGVPLVELIRPYMPLWLQRLVLEFLTFVVFGRYETYGLQKPDHRLFEHHPTINSELLHYIRLGDIAPHRDIESFTGGRTVKFVDGTSIEVDLIVCCTGYHNSIPLLKPYVETIGNVPQLISGVFVPDQRHIYFMGMGQPRYGAGPLLTAGAEFLAKAILVQDELQHPISNLLAKLGGKAAKTNGKSADILIDPHVSYKETVVATMLIPYLPLVEKFIAEWL